MLFRSPKFGQVEDRLRGLDEKLDGINHAVSALDDRFDRINHQVVHLGESVQENQYQILAARHEAHVLMVTDIDASNEATALFGRSLADHRQLVEERLDRIETAVAELAATVALLAGQRAPASDDAPVT